MEDGHLWLPALKYSHGDSNSDSATFCQINLPSPGLTYSPCEMGMIPESLLESCFTHPYPRKSEPKVEGGVFGGRAEGGAQTDCFLALEASGSEGA